MADTATLQARLTEAESALHELVMGRQVVEVSNEIGNRLRYAVYEKGQERLEAYIESLKAQLGQSSRRRPIVVGF